MAAALDDAIAVAPVGAAVEPDESACFTQTGVKPAHVYPDRLMPATGANDFAVVKNTLVFTSTKGREHCKADGSLATTSLNHFDRLLPVVGVYKKDCDLSVVGVAYDGVVSEQDAQAYPDAMGRVVVQITGTVTVTIHPNDIANLDVNDLICLSGDAYVGGLVGMPHVTLPKIVKYETDAYTYLLRLLLSRVRLGGHWPVSAWSYGVAICALHRDKHAALWSKCKDQLNAMGASDMPISKALQEKSKIDSILTSISTDVQLDTEQLAVARLDASVFSSTDELEKLIAEIKHRPSAIDSPQNFKSFLEIILNTRMPFGYVLELGHNQARIQLKPGVTL